MSWVTAFVSNWYSIAYVQGGVFLLYVAWSISTVNFTTIPFHSDNIAKSAKFLMIIFLLILAGSLFYGALQLTSFTHYLSIKKMAPV